MAVVLMTFSGVLIAEAEVTTTTRSHRRPIENIDAAGEIDRGLGLGLHPLQTTLPGVGGIDSSRIRPGPTATICGILPILRRATPVQPRDQERSLRLSDAPGWPGFAPKTKTKNRP
jgi:hypothetical protein